VTHVLSDGDTEGQLRELLRDPGWSLRPWPDAEARVRRAARRQRLRAAGLTAGAGAASTAVALSLAMLGSAPRGTFSTASTSILTCGDSAGQQGRGTPPARLVNGVDGFIGDANAYDTLPVQHRGGHRYLAWKTALAVAPDARPYRIVSVTSPGSALVAYGPAAPSRSVRLAVCGHRYTLYTGGILVRHPACVVLTVSGPAGKPVTVEVPVLRACPSRAR
jgi:hypothetical protein